MLDLDSPVPLWEQLADVMRERIRSREFTGRLPSAKSLAQEYEVSSRTSERALKALKAEGLVVAVVGRGYYIAK